MNRPPLILASTSASRHAMLSAAGIDFTPVGSHVDEDSVKAAMSGAGEPVRAIADRLAELKALKVSGRHPGAFVIGSDSMVALSSHDFLDKPGTIAALADQLRTLRGRTHRLLSAVAVARDGAILWRHVDTATLHVRPFTDDFLASYIAACGQDVCHSVGGYHLEARGVQLFDRIEGDSFTVRGLPLIPLLAWLRSAGAIAA